MSKADFIPKSDHDFLVWLEHLVSKLQSGVVDIAMTENELSELKADYNDFHDKIATASDAQATAKQATANKNDSRHNAESMIRALVRRLKASPTYSEAQGVALGVVGHEISYDFTSAKPNLSALDHTGGVVTLSFNKYRSDGINIYCQRETDADWILLGRATVSPFQDNRPLLRIGKSEMRRYSAVYMQKDTEVSPYSDDVVISCIP